MQIKLINGFVYNYKSEDLPKVKTSGQSRPRRLSQSLQSGQQARVSLGSLFRNTSSTYWQGQSACVKCRGAAGLPPSSSRVQSSRRRRKSFPHRCRYRRYTCSAIPCTFVCLAYPPKTTKVSTNLLSYVLKLNSLRCTLHSNKESYLKGKDPTKKYNIDL